MIIVMFLENVVMLHDKHIAHKYKQKLICYNSGLADIHVYRKHTGLKIPNRNALVKNNVASTRACLTECYSVDSIKDEIKSIERW